jgi:dipeptidyl aminopeptidase/acylaminoacyl peptidase
MSIRSVFGVALLCSLTMVCVAGDQRHPISADDILNLRDISDAQISPDGKWVAFVMGAEGGWAGPRNPHIWIVATDGTSPARLFAASNKGERFPRWSPDGRFLAFISKRPAVVKPEELNGQGPLTDKTANSKEDEKEDNKEEEPTEQIWVMRMDGGEAVPLTTVKGNVSRFDWSPNGTKIAFTVQDPFTDEQKKKHEHRDDRNYVDHEYRLVRLWTIDLQSHAVRRTLDQDLNVNQVVWSPDGKQLALRISKTPRMVDYWWRNKVIVLDEASGKITGTISETANATEIRWSPDGQRISFGESTPSGITFRPAVSSSQGGKSQLLDGSYHGSIWDMRWKPDSRNIIAQSIEGTTTKFVNIDIEMGKISELASTLGEVGPFSVSRDAKRIAFVGQTFSSPSDVWVFEIGQTPRQITHSHPQVADWNLGTAREINWKNKKDGKTIYGVLITPPGFVEGKKYPTVVQIHGGPEWAWWSGWMGSWHDWGQYLASHGYVVLLPNPRGSDGQGWEFAEAVRGDWGGMDFEDVLSGVDDLVAKNIADSEHLGIGGWSYGGFMSSWAVSHTNRFKAAVIGAAVTDLISFAGTSDVTPSFPGVYFNGPYYQNWQLYEAHSPMTFVKNAKTPSLILHGEADPRVPTTQGLEFYNALQMLGVTSEMVTYPREPHGINERAHQADLLFRVLNWYDTYVR